MQNKIALLALFLCASFSLFSMEDDLVTPPLATVTHLLPGCGTSYGGEIGITLNGDPNLFTYWWEHDPDERSLLLTDLPAGPYIFHVRDFYGCEEVLKIDMIIVDKINHEVIVTAGRDDCTAQIEVLVRDQASGILLDTSFFQITWFDTYPYPSTFRRVVDVTLEDQTFNFIVGSVYNNGQSLEICVVDPGTITIPGSTDCRPSVFTKSPSVIVNETKSTPSGQYVELLVLGKYECGESTDLRGFALDDNNGQLIPLHAAGTTSEQPSEGGVDPGYLQFQFHDNWAAVPNGSLIVIYEEGTQQFALVDDPTDQNQDGVYVLSANDESYLYGKTSEWNSDGLFYDYTDGVFFSPTWESIKLSSPADGMQVRNSDGIFSHGFSLGENQQGEENEFPLNLDLGDISQAGCQFVQTDIWDKTHYSCEFSATIPGTPGLPNSSDNEELILSLRACDPPNMALQGDDVQDYFNSKDPRISVYPNPFTGKFTIEYTSSTEGSTLLKLITPSGKVLDNLLISTSIGANEEPYTPKRQLPSGVYLVQLTLPTGEHLQQRIISIHN